MSSESTNGAGCLRGLLRLNKTHFENISGALSEIGTPGTLKGSHGTNFFSKIFSYNVIEVYVVRFGGF